MILDEMSVSIDEDFTPQQKHEIKSMIDNPKNSTYKSMALNFTIKKSVSLVQVYKFINQLMDCLQRNICVSVDFNIDENLKKTANLNLKIFDNEDEIKENK